MPLYTKLAIAMKWHGLIWHCVDYMIISTEPNIILLARTNQDSHILLMTYLAMVPPWYLYSHGLKWPIWTSKLHCGSKSGHASLRTPVFSSGWSYLDGSHSVYCLCYWNSFAGSCSTSRCDIGMHPPLIFILVLVISTSIDICHIFWPSLRWCSSLRKTSSTHC